jgi:hypothetical protein
VYAFRGVVADKVIPATVFQIALPVPLVADMFTFSNLLVELNQSCPGKGAAGAVESAKFSINLIKF